MDGPLCLQAFIDKESLAGLHEFERCSYTQVEVAQTLLIQSQDWLKLVHPRLLLLHSFPDDSRSQELKLSGNAKYGAKQFLLATVDYSHALHLATIKVGCVGLQFFNGKMQDVKLTATLYFNRSSCLRHLGLLSHSLADCEQALTILPDYPKAQNLRAEILFGLGRATLEDFKGFELTKANTQHLQQLGETSGNQHMIF